MDNSKEVLETNKSSFKPNRNCKSCNGLGWIVSPPVEYLCRECEGKGVK